MLTESHAHHMKSLDVINDDNGSTCFVYTSYGALSIETRLKMSRYILHSVAYRVSLFEFDENLSARDI